MLGLALTRSLTGGLPWWLFGLIMLGLSAGFVILWRAAGRDSRRRRDQLAEPVRDDLADQFDDLAETVAGVVDEQDQLAGRLAAIEHHLRLRPLPRAGRHRSPDD